MCGLIVCLFGVAVICIAFPIFSLLFSYLFGYGLFDIFWILLSFIWEVLFMIKYGIYFYGLGTFVYIIDRHYTELARTIAKSKINNRYSNESSTTNNNNIYIFGNIALVLGIISSLYFIMFILEGWINPFVKLPYFVYASYIFGLVACFPLESHLNQETYNNIVSDQYYFYAKITSKIPYNGTLFFIIFSTIEYLLVNDSLFYEFYQVNWKEEFRFLNLFTELF